MEKFSQQKLVRIHLHKLRYGCVIRNTITGVILGELHAAVTNINMVELVDEFVT